MNVLDSELVLGQLAALGYEPAEDYRQADLVLLNTCSVRQHAEDKVYSRLGEIAKAKIRRPQMIVGVMGCMAERDTDGLKAKAPCIDLLCGPGNLNEIPMLLAEVEDQRAGEGTEEGRGDAATRGRGDKNKKMHRVLAVALEKDHSRRAPVAERTLIYDSIESLDLSRAAPTNGRALQAYVRVQRGCDKFCTYCVVPFTRGPERSRPPEHIVQEVRKLADLGTKEITLLGQTVNSYKYAEDGGAGGSTHVSFADLLERVHEVPGVERIRFVTSYPGEFGDDVLQAMRDLPKVCEYLHIPAQSGSNAVLQRMKRQYSVEQYEELLARAREIVPGISLAGDFIVGFCGETEADHEQTLALVERTRYKNIYMFKYSQRPGTVADRRLADDVPEDVKQRRHTELAALQKRMCLAHHQGLIGREVEVLVEGYSKAAIKAQEAEQARGHNVSWKRTDQLTGRTRGDEIVVFTGSEALIGQFVRIKVTAATTLTLHGEVVTRPEKSVSLTVL
jgi:tRNA-2-methylthio-N6-dimethylallyladenosine synthase